MRMNAHSQPVKTDNSQGLECWFRLACWPLRSGATLSTASHNSPVGAEPMPAVRSDDPTAGQLAEQPEV